MSRATGKAKSSKATETSYTVGASIRGDKILITAQKIIGPRLVRKSGQHKGSEVVAEKDARATLLRAYTKTSN